VHDGWEYVVAAYGVAGATLAIWFWMIGAKLRRTRQQSQVRVRVEERPRG
jgi:hypothetical protein